MGLSLGLGLGLGRRSGAPFSPVALSAAAWYEIDRPYCFTDTAMTTPVTASGQAVAAVQDRSGNGNHWIQATSAKRPLYIESGGLKYLLFDGSDDAMGPLASSGISARTNYEFLIGARVLSSITNNAPGFNNTSVFWGDSSANIGLTVRSNNTIAACHYVSSTNTDFVDVAYTLATDAVFGQRHSGTTLVGAVDATEVSATRNQTGVLGANARLGTWYDDSTRRANMRYFGSIHMLRVLTAGERANARAWLAAKQGRTL